MEFEYDIFISFADEDRNMVAALERELKAKGLKVWCSLSKLRERAVNPSISAEIARILPRCRYLLPFISPNYINDYERKEFYAFTHSRLTKKFFDEAGMLENSTPLDDSVIPVVYQTDHDFIAAEYHFINDILFIKYMDARQAADEVLERINPTIHSPLEEETSDQLKRIDVQKIFFLTVIILLGGLFCTLENGLNRSLISHFWGETNFSPEYRITSWILFLYMMSWVFGLLLDNLQIGNAIERLHKSRINPILHNPVQYIHTFLFGVMSFANLAATFYHTLLVGIIFWLTNTVLWYQLKAGLQPELFRSSLAYQRRRDIRMQQRMRRINYFLFGHWQLTRFKFGFYYLVALLIIHFVGDQLLHLPDPVLFTLKLLHPLFIVIFEIWFWRERIQRDVK